MGHCLLKITALSLYTVHFPNFFRPAEWLWTKPRPCNKWVTPLHRHIINEVLEMTEAFSIETKPNYKPRDIFNPLTMKDESRNVRAALVVPWWRREYEWINFTVFWKWFSRGYQLGPGNDLCYINQIFHIPTMLILLSCSDGSSNELRMIESKCKIASLDFLS